MAVARPISLREVEAPCDVPVTGANDDATEAVRIVRPDPRPDPVRVAADQVTNLITNMDNATRMNWGETRGLMDQLMHEHAERGQEIAASVVGYAQEAAELISTSQIIRTAVQGHLDGRKG